MRFSKLPFSTPSLLNIRANKLQERPFQPLLGFTLELQSKDCKGGREAMARGMVEMGKERAGAWQSLCEQSRLGMQKGPHRDP